ncbi:MAG: hypothetical protein Q9226_000818 [Calogaya cf. arnoldii]
MSFGWSASDLALLVRLAYKTSQGARAACGQYDELTRETSSLHVVLNRLKVEAAKPGNPINKDKAHGKELGIIANGCKDVLTQLDKVLVEYNALSEQERSVRRLWKKIKFGNGVVADVAVLRSKITYYTSSLTLFLNMASLGTIGNVEGKMDKAGGDLQDIKNAVNRLSALISETQQEHATRDTFNLLLEFGECDLDEFFAHRNPPVLQDETDQFWKALFEVADALDGLHNPQIPTHGVVRELLGSTSISAGDYFHDGRQVLDAVIDWHKVLRNVLRHTDTVTSGLLDLVDQKMLLGSATLRIKARDLCSELKSIVAQSEAAPRIKMPQNIIETLLEADTEAASSIPLELVSKTSGQLASPDNRKARKSRLLGQPLMKTAHRSQALKSVLASYNEYITDQDSPNIQEVARSSPADPTAHIPSSLVPAHTLLLDHQAHAEAFPRGRSPLVTKVGPPPFPFRNSQKHTRTPKTHTTQDIFQAREEIKERDKYKKFISKERKEKLLTKHFGNRDLHWAWAKALLITLVEKAAGQDKNGLDLSFTLGKEKLENEKSTSSKWEKRMTEAEPMNEARTNMRVPLNEILSEYLEYVKHIGHQKRLNPKKSYRKMTLIILTDGIWSGMGKNQNAVIDTIVNFVRDLGSVVGDLVDRPVSIEFVQFGHDPEATYRLRHLDTDLNWKGIPDIIDTEPADGDVNKMLLGSFVEEYYDEDEDGQLEESETPIQQTASPDELSFVSSPPRSSHRESMNRPASPAKPSVFISRPTG